MGTLYDGVGSVKRHLDCMSQEARFFFETKGPQVVCQSLEPVRQINSLRYAEEERSLC
jgi:hypothetical protein